MKSMKKHASLRAVLLALTSCLSLAIASCSTSKNLSTASQKAHPVPARGSSVEHDNAVGILTLIADEPTDVRSATQNVGDAALRAYAVPLRAAGLVVGWGVAVPFVGLMSAIGGHNLYPYLFE